MTFVIDGRSRTVEFEPGSLPYGGHGRPGSLLDIALHFDIPLEHACGGFAGCTTCHVIVTSGAGNLSAMEDEEADRLDTAWDVRPESRLACQAIPSGDVVCEVPHYTRNYVGESGGIKLGR